MNIITMTIYWFVVRVSFFGLGLNAARVTTTHGVIEGFTEIVYGETVDIYLGIPFAKPPVGDLRFRLPQSAEKWPGVKETKMQPNTCVQLADTLFEGFEGSEMWNPNTEVSEDCLYLNIWVPRRNDSQTMIWIYGGAFTSGSISLDVYNGLYLAAKNRVIVASMQYRLSTMGFLFLGSDDAPGNMGLFDQRLAMRWIYENIERFGGHKDKITLFGESAGAGSVSHHLLSKPSWSFFNRAILLSGSSLARWAVSNPDELSERTKALANLVGCSNNEEIVKCLRKLDALYIELSNAKLDGRYGPTVDGVFLVDYPDNMLYKGRVKPTEIMLGNTKDEGEYFFPYFYPDIFPSSSIWNPVNLSRDQFLDLVCRVGGCHGDLERKGLLYVYERSKLPSNRDHYVDIIDDMLGDSFMKCPVRNHGIHHAKTSRKPTYVYSFDYRHSVNPWPSWMGALHGYEIEILFGLPFNPKLNYSDLDRKVSSKMMDCFVEFARTGNPNLFGDEWPEFKPNSEQHIVFTQDGTTYVREGYRTKECSFWEYLMPRLKQEATDSRIISGSANQEISLGVLVIALLLTTEAFIHRFEHLLGYRFHGPLKRLTVNLF